MPGLQVARIVPGERAYPVPWTHSQLLPGQGAQPGPLVVLPVRHCHQAPLLQPGDHHLAAAAHGMSEAIRPNDVMPLLLGRVTDSRHT